MRGSPGLLKKEFCGQGLVGGEVVSIKLKARGASLAAKAEMASYGRQFELMMTTIGIDLIRKYKSEGSPSDIEEFVREFFNSDASCDPPHFPQPSSPSVVSAPPKKGKASKGKGGAKKEYVTPPDEKRCEAKTVKGERCSKCIKDGEVFCSVHLKKQATPPQSPKKKGKKGKKAEPVAEVEVEAEPEPETEVEEPLEKAKRIKAIMEEASSSTRIPKRAPIRGRGKKPSSPPLPPPPPLTRTDSVVHKGSPAIPSWADEEAFDGEEAADPDETQAGEFLLNFEEDE